MVFKLRAYLTFLCRATNQHGVHSPFVYNLVTLCFYASEKRNIARSVRGVYTNIPKISCTFSTAKLLNRLPVYLSSVNIMIPSETHWINAILRVGNTLNITTTLQKNQYYDVLFIDTTAFTLQTFKSLILQLPQHIHNDSVVILHPIHDSLQNEQLWEYIKSHPITQVSIDTFTLGFIFFRQEQAKQDFYIRL